MATCCVERKSDLLAGHQAEPTAPQNAALVIFQVSSQGAEATIPAVCCQQPTGHYQRCIDRWQLEPFDDCRLPTPPTERSWCWYEQTRSHMEEMNRPPAAGSSEGSSCKTAQTTHNAREDEPKQTEGCGIQTTHLFLADPVGVPATECSKWNVWSRLASVRAVIDYVVPGLGRHFYCMRDDLEESQSGGPQLPCRSSNSVRLFSPALPHAVKIDASFDLQQPESTDISNRVRYNFVVQATLECAAESRHMRQYNLINSQRCSYRHNQNRSIISSKRLKKIQIHLFGRKNSKESENSRNVGQTTGCGRRLPSIQIFELLLHASYAGLALQYCEMPWAKWLQRETILSFDGNDDDLSDAALLSDTPSNSSQISCNLAVVHKWTEPVVDPADDAEQPRFAMLGLKSCEKHECHNCKCERCAKEGNCNTLNPEILEQNVDDGFDEDDEDEDLEDELDEDEECRPKKSKPGRGKGRRKAYAELDEDVCDDDAILMELMKGQPLENGECRPRRSKSGRGRGRRSAYAELDEEGCDDPALMELMNEQPIEDDECRPRKSKPGKGRGRRRAYAEQEEEGCNDAMPMEPVKAQPFEDDVAN